MQTHLYRKPRLLEDELTSEADFYAGEQSVACVMDRVSLCVE